MKKVIIAGFAATIMSCAIGVASAYEYSHTVKKAAPVTASAKAMCDECTCSDCTCPDCSGGTCNDGCCGNGACCDKK